MHGPSPSVSSDSSGTSASSCLSNDDEPIVLVRSDQAWTTARVAKPALLVAHHSSSTTTPSHSSYSLSSLTSSRGSSPPRHAYPCRPAPDTPPETPKPARGTITRHKVTRSITKAIERVKAKSTSSLSLDRDRFGTKDAPAVPALPTSFSCPNNGSASMTRAELSRLDAPSSNSATQKAKPRSVFKAVTSSIQSKLGSQKGSPVSSLLTPASAKSASPWTSSLSLASSYKTCRTDQDYSPASPAPLKFSQFLPHALKPSARQSSDTRATSSTGRGSTDSDVDDDVTLDIHTRAPCRRSPPTATATLDNAFEAFDMSSPASAQRAFAFPQSRSRQQEPTTPVDRALPPLPLFTTQSSMAEQKKIPRTTRSSSLMMLDTSMTNSTSSKLPKLTMDVLPPTPPDSPTHSRLVFA